MMNSYLKNQECRLAIGTRVLGKWHKKPYKIVRKLGAGTSGTVYLADSAAGLVALKIGSDSMSITSEVNVLKHFSKVQGKSLGPSLFDVDDLLVNGKTYPFYVMEYVKGEPFIPYMQDRGNEWLALLMIQLLGDLQRLHIAGWVFGDLKPDNLLVAGPPARVRLLDVGGTTLIGRAIKEYTEFFDRGYWELGSRKAEPSYDLFAVGMIMINCGYPSRFEKTGDNPLKCIKKRIDEQPFLHPYRTIIIRALQGHYIEANEMRDELLKVVSNGGLTKERAPHQQARTKNKRKVVKKKGKKEKKSSYFVEVFLIASFLLLSYILYLFGQMM